jgi:L-seryl-tRNA(Ser) seleniumtransferase
MRALRVDKVTYALLEATLALWADAPARTQVPIYRMLTMTVDEIGRRAQALADELSRTRGVRAGVIDGESAPGGGSAPGQTLPTKLVTLAVDDETPQRPARSGCAHSTRPSSRESSTTRSSSTYEPCSRTTNYRSRGR